MSVRALFPLSILLLLPSCMATRTLRVVNLSTKPLEFDELREGKSRTLRIEPRGGQRVIPIARGSDMNVNLYVYRHRGRDSSYTSGVDLGPVKYAFPADYRTDLARWAEVGWTTQTTDHDGGTLTVLRNLDARLESGGRTWILPPR